jgi:SOS-response transcriptional repressor LexA
MAVADEVRRRLESRPGSKHFASWLKKSVGSLEPDEHGWELLSAIHRLGEISKVIVTTNYDTLLESKGSGPAVDQEWQAATWKDDDWHKAASRRWRVLHLHGMAENPKSVILSSADYERIAHDQLDQIVGQFILMNQFLFIGCGDGLSDPHIGPLLRKARELLAARKTDQTKDQEHFILVRGCELQRLIDNPLPGTITPVAYGNEFSDLTDFLCRLREGLELGVSQDPRDYLPTGSTAPAVTSSKTSRRANKEDRPAAEFLPAEGEVAPPVTPLSRQVLAERQMQAALAAVRRAARAMDGVAVCVTPQIGMTLLDPVSQLALHEHLAGMATKPTDRLHKLLRKARKAVVTAAREVRTAAALAEPGSTPTTTQTAPTATLKALTAELAERVAMMHDDLAQRAITSSTRYLLLLSVMAEARDEAADACHEAAELARLLDPRSPLSDAGQADANPLDAKKMDPPDPDPRNQRSAQAELPFAQVTSTDMDTRPVQPIFAAAAGPGTDKELHDEPLVPVPSSLAEGNVIVVKVEGESMAGDDIHNGYLLVVDPQRPIRTGEIAVFEKEGAGKPEKFVKRVSAGQDGASYSSSNPSYPGGTFSAADNAYLIGKVVAIVRAIS